jgi:proteasome lid subunit RPN8/RPN11
MSDKEKNIKQAALWTAFVAICTLPMLVGSLAASASTPMTAATFDPTAHVYLPYVARDWPPMLEILIPLYAYPNWYDPETYIWDDVAAANSQVPITVIINPDSGPGGCPPNVDYQHGLDDLREAGVTILGYVHTSYSERDVEDVKSEIDQYDQCFDIHGIFLDEVYGGSCSAERCGYYQELYEYVKSRPNLDTVICNPGTQVDECYLSRPACDTVVAFEGYSSSWPEYEPCAYVTAYPSERFALIVHSVPDVDTMKSHIDLAVARNIGYVYVTDDTLPNPYDSLPSFWQAEVDYIESLRRGTIAGQ